jgi:D-glycero-beta-D-manno-heptose-7-phosphate kinase
MHSDLDLPAFFKSIMGMPVVVVGDTMVDAYIHGGVERISPEAPVPIVHVHRREDRLGGAGNVALNLIAMGAEPRLCTVIGQDAAGERLLKLMESLGLKTDWVVRSDRRLTTVKTRIICRNQQMMRVDDEEIRTLDEEEATRLIAAARNALGDRKAQAAIFQDYDKGVLTAQTIPVLVEACKNASIPICVDPKRANFHLYRDVSLFKPNLREVTDSLPDLEISADPAHLDAAAHAIRERLDNAVTMITLGEKGLFLQVGGESRLYPAHRRDIADVSGAGDTVISVAALGLAAGLDVSAWARLANLAGGQVCEHLGVVPVDREKLQAEANRLLAAG